MKKDLQDYLGDAFNLEVYNALTEKGKWYSLFVPKSYFDLLYERFDIINEQLSKPLDIVNDLRNLGLDDKEYYFLLDCLMHLIFDSAAPIYGKLNLNTGSYKSLPIYLIYQIPRFQADPVSSQKEKSLFSVFSFIKKEQDKINDKLEANHIYLRDAEVEYEEEADVIKPKLKLAEREGNKTELLRILLALYDLNMVESADGSKLSESKFVKHFFDVFGEKLSNFYDSKNKALDVDIKTQVKIFDDLKKAAQKRLNDIHSK